MKKKMLIIFLMVLVIAVSLCGCWNLREIDTLAVVVGTGYDRSKASDNLQLSFQVVKPSGIKSAKDSSSGSAEKAYFNIEEEGLTSFGTLRDVTHKASRKLYWPHNKIIALGRQAAELGVQEFVDFYMRDQETRTTVWVMVVDGKASDLWKVHPDLDKIPAIHLDNLMESQKATSQTSIVDLQQFIARLMSKTTAPIAPWVEVRRIDDESTAILSGTAVFKKDKLIGRLDEKETRGLLWVLGEAKSGIMDVPFSTENETVSLEIIKANGEFNVELENGAPKVFVKVQEAGNIGAQKGRVNVTTKEAIEVLQNAAEAYITAEISAALKKAKEYDADIFGFGEAFHRKYPKEWKSMESKWDEIFPQIEVKIEVKAIIQRAGMVSRPARPLEEVK